MGIALLTIADLLMPLQAIASRWSAPRLSWRNRRDRRELSAGLRYVAIHPSCGTRKGDAAAGGTAPASRPLRVIRVVDGRHATCASRVVISGRMADVCDELDRLAALEACALPATTTTSAPRG
jgi:hypothetical protein